MVRDKLCDARRRGQPYDENDDVQTLRHNQRDNIQPIAHAIPHCVHLLMCFVLVHQMTNAFYSVSHM